MNRYIEKTTLEHGIVSTELRHLPFFRDVTLVFAVIATGLSSFYTVGEGNRAIITRLGKAVYQTDPGFHFKRPFTDSVNHIEIRERKSLEELSAATANQLPVTASVSINWIAQPESAMEIYRKYGSLEQFENRILDPRLRQSAKAAISKFGAAKLIRNRQEATAESLTILTGLMEGYPVTVNSPQIENISLPETYMQSVLKKEQAREDAVREQYNLEKQNLEAQRSVQSAKAERDAAMARADGVAYKVRTEAAANAYAIRLTKIAEADGITAVESSLASNSLFVDYTRALNWDGRLPQTILGGGENILFGMPK